MSSVFAFPNPVNEVAARLVAAGVALIGLACPVLRQPSLMVRVACGFPRRVAFGARIDPLALLVPRVLVPRLPRAERPTAGPPKRFAQSIGLFVTTTASLLVYGTSFT